jgi:hypothetical protein
MGSEKKDAPIPAIAPASIELVKSTRTGPSTFMTGTSLPAPKADLGYCSGRPAWRQPWITLASQAARISGA